MDDAAKWFHGDPEVRRQKAIEWCRANFPREQRPAGPAPAATIIEGNELLTALRIDVFRQARTAVMRITDIPTGHTVSGEYGEGFPSELAVKERLINELRALASPLLHDEGAGL